MNPSTWRSEVDIPVRLMILRKTQDLFETIQVNCDSEVFAKTLGVLIPKLETELYMSATSLEEYGNPNTVEARLERMAPWNVHLKPLEALWLQGLLAATNAPSVAMGVIDRRRCLGAAAAPAAVLPIQCNNNNNPLPVMVSLELATPKDRPELPPTHILGAQQHSNNNATSTTSSSQQTNDEYTQSLVTLYEYLKHYDEVSNRTETVDFPSELSSLVPPPAAAGPSEAPDLRCNEKLEDSSEDGGDDKMSP